MEDSTKKAGMLGGLVVAVVSGVLVNVLTDWFKPWTSRESSDSTRKVVAEPAILVPAAPSPPSKFSERSRKPIDNKSITIPDAEDE